MQNNSVYRVSVKGIEFDDNARILLVKEGDAWDILGGGLAHNEDPVECLKREIFEEAGLKITYVSSEPKYFVTALHSRGGYVANAIYEIKLENLDFVPSKECQELKYFSLEEMKKVKLFPNVQSLVRQLEGGRI